LQAAMMTEIQMCAANINMDSLATMLTTIAALVYTQVGLALLQLGMPFVIYGIIASGGSNIGGLATMGMGAAVASAATMTVSRIKRMLGNSGGGGGTPTK